MKATEKQLKNLIGNPLIPLNKNRILDNIKINANGCWIWQKCIGKNGYGNLRHRKKTYTLHRLSYSLIVGEIPKNMHVLHKCDVRSCCNPDHLFLGTNLDNIRDSVNKNRRKGISRVRPKMKYKPMSEIGRKNHRKLNDDQIVELKKLHIAGFSYPQLAEKYNVNQATIWRYNRHVTV